ncbi:MAG: hypothetical protein ABIC04_01470 [Nanoarchaeota archaeon]
MKKKKRWIRKIKRTTIVWAVLVVILLLIFMLNKTYTPQYSAKDFAEILSKNEKAIKIIGNIDSEKVNIETKKLDSRTIEIEQYGPYKAMYEGLPENHNLYKVVVTDSDKKKGLVSIIDMTTKEALKVYGLLNLQM